MEWQALLSSIDEFIWQLAINLGCYMVLYIIYFISENVTTGVDETAGEEEKLG